MHSDRGAADSGAALAFPSKLGLQPVGLLKSHFQQEDQETEVSRDRYRSELGDHAHDVAPGFTGRESGFRPRLAGAFNLRLRRCLFVGH
jgi:hypothetical protein